MATENPCVSSGPVGKDADPGIAEFEGARNRLAGLKE